VADLIIPDPRAENGFSTKGEINMKKMLFAVTALAALSLLAPTTGFAQGAHNQMGVYLDAEMSATNVTAAAFDIVNVHLIVTNPYNEALNRPIESISGIEVRFIMPAGLAIDSATIWSAEASDFGNAPDGHIVGFGQPIPTVNGVAHIATKSIIVMNITPFGVTLGPHTSIPSIPGAMAILDFDGEHIQELYPASNDYAEPVFGFNQTVVATESTSFDKLKALYR